MKVGDKVKCIDNGDFFSLTVGNIYTVIRASEIDGEPSIYVIKDNGSEAEYYQRRFELVSESSSLMEDIEKAKALIGKKVRDKKLCSMTGTVEDVYVLLSLSSGTSYSLSVRDEFKKFGYAVVVKWGDYHYGLSQVEEFPTIIEVPLTSDYTAKVYSDKVVVGCQTITKETFDKVAEAFRELNQ